MTDSQDKPRPLASPIFAAAAYEEDEPAPAEPSPFERELASELRSLRIAVGKLGAVPDLGTELEELRAAVERLGAPTARGPVGAAIRATGVEGRYATELCRAIAGHRGSPAEVEDALRATLRERVPTTAWPLADVGRRVIAAVGMSGVGKTTTLAKLAVHARLDGRSVALVSCDDFRVGGAYQLERYAELLEVPFHVAHSQADLERIVREETAEVVLVDTSGRPPTTAAPEMALRTMKIDKDVLLCLPASARACDAERAAQAFAPMRPSSVAVTKIDETRVPAGLVHGPLAARLPLSVLTFGARVPEDVASAVTDDFAVRVLAPRSEAAVGASTRDAAPATPRIAPPQAELPGGVSAAAAKASKRAKPRAEASSASERADARAATAASTAPEPPSAYARTATAASTERPSAAEARATRKKARAERIALAKRTQQTIPPPSMAPDDSREEAAE